MARKPRCIVCNSKRWHRDTLSGSIVCEEGHLLQGYVQESNEATTQSQHTQTTRKIRKNKQRKYKPPPNQHFHGDRANFLLFQCFQWILREQLRVLIEELGWPNELEFIVRDLWAMYVASCNLADAPGEFERGEEGPGNYCGPRPGTRFRRGRKRKKKFKVKGETGTEGEEEIDEGEESEVEDDFEQADNEINAPNRKSRSVRSNSIDSNSSILSNSSATNSENEARDDIDPSQGPSNRNSVKHELGFKPRKLPRPRSRIAPNPDPRAQPRMEFLLLIIYLGCVTLRLPVFMRDIIHLAETYQILYIDAKIHLPAEMQQSLNTSMKSILDPRDVPSLERKLFSTDSPAASTYEWLRRLVRMYQEDFNVRFPEANLPLLGWRLCRNLACPPVFYDSLCRLLSCVQPQISFTIRASKSFDKIGKEADLNDWPEAILAAGLIIVIKMVYGLGSTDSIHEPILKSLPRFENLLRAIRKIEQIEQNENLSDKFNRPVTNLDSDEIDEYLTFFETRIASNENLPPRMNELDRIFPPAADFPQIASRRNPTKQKEIDDIIANLYQSVESRVMDSNNEQALPPPQYVQHLMSGKGSVPNSDLPAALEQILAAASRQIYISDASSHSIAVLVQRLEALLVRRGGVKQALAEASSAEHATRQAKEISAQQERETRWQRERQRRTNLKGLVHSSRSRKSKNVKKKIAMTSSDVVEETEIETDSRQSSLAPQTETIQEIDSNDETPPRRSRKRRRLDIVPVTSRKNRIVPSSGSIENVHPVVKSASIVLESDEEY